MAIFRELAFEGQVRRILVVPQTRRDDDDIASASASGSVDVSYEGFPGERHSGFTRACCVRFTDIYEEGTEIRNTRQLSIISEEEMALVAEGMGIDRIEPEWMGANLLIAGIPDFTLLPPSSRLLFSQGLSLVIDMENEPCGYPARQIRAVHGTKGLTFVKNAKHRRGVTAWVEQEGRIAEGDSFRVFIPKQPAWPGRLAAGQAASIPQVRYLDGETTVVAPVTFDTMPRFPARTLSGPQKRRNLVTNSRSPGHRLRA